MKKALALLLALCLALGLATVTASAEADPVTVQFLATSGSSHKVLVDAFNASHDDVQIELDETSSSWGDVSTKLITLIAADMAPDIAVASTSYYPQFASQGLLLDITDYIEENLSEDEYYWSILDGLHYDGRLYGLPMSIYTLVNYFNKDLYDAAGIEYPPLTWGEGAWTKEEWHDIAAKLTSGEGLEKVYGAWVEYQLERTLLFAFTEGLNYWGEDLYPQFDNEEIIDIHKWLYDMLHEEQLMPDSSTRQTTSTNQLFADARLANYITGTWSHGTIAQSENVNFGVCPVPGGITVGYVDVYMPIASTDTPDQTKLAAAWLISEEACTIKYENNIWGPQVNRVATEKCADIMFKGLTPEEKQCIFDSLENCRPLTVFDKWAEFLDASLLPASQMMEIGEYTVEEGFAILQEEALALLGF